MSRTTGGRGLGRRAFLGSAALAGGSAALLPSAGRAAETRPDRAVAAGVGIAEAETISGKVAGYVDKAIFTFKGIPYAASTAGANRFLPPTPPAAGTGARSSRSYGPICPQDQGTGRLNDEEAFLFQWNDAVQAEDCLRLNLWTPSVSDRRRRPVMVWLHGGGFEAGSGHDLLAFDGRNLAARGDVVVVTLNHRLNLLGFLDLSAYGERYAQSANVGMLDIVAALRWVHDNVEAFGGDPANVTIFGQSGGGAKVSTLMGMPSARGLFHRAVVQSGSFPFYQSPEQSRRLAALLIAELGISAPHVDRLAALPYAELLRASQAVLRRENPAGGLPLDPRSWRSRLGYAPVVDGAVLPEAPFVERAPAISAQVPMIIGTTLNEFASGFNHPEYESLTETELASRVETLHPGRSGAIIAAFRQRTPNAKPFDIWSRIASAPVRAGAIAQAAAKASQGSAPAFLYWFAWQTPVLDGRPRAFHCAELPFVFANAERCAQMTGGGDRARALESVVADAWIAFARTGDPNHRGMERWMPYSKALPGTMIFDDHSATRIAVDRAELDVLNG